ncbi:MAG: metallophosphoesterase [Flavobacteriaceae bacterium]
MERRAFIHRSGLGLIASMLPQQVIKFNPLSFTSKSRLRFGIIADVHKDLMPDANERLEAFIEEAMALELDFIVQLGDFCMADSGNKSFMKIWETFKNPRYHVLGNHDMDRHSKEEMLDFWEMPKTYYSYDFQGYHFVALDANYLYLDGKFVDYDKSNFYVDNNLRTYINQEQIEWLKSDLEATSSPTIVFSHQSLWHYHYGVKNRLSVQKILENHKEKVVCCFNGHNHIDFHHHQNGIDYIEINSASYYWTNDKYRNSERYPEELYKQFKWLPNLATYKDPLYAIVTLDSEGTLKVEGKRSEWVAPSPSDIGMPPQVYGSEYSAEISDYTLNYKDNG